MKWIVFGKTGNIWEDSTKGIPFFVTFHPKLTFFAKKIKKLSDYLHIGFEVKAKFTPTPMVAFCSARKLKDYLVRVKLYPLEWNLGFRKCNKSRCKVCNIIENTDLFSSTVIGEAYKINHHFILLYLISSITLHYIILKYITLYYIKLHYLNT